MTWHTFHCPNTEHFRLQCSEWYSVVDNTVYFRIQCSWGCTRVEDTVQFRIQCSWVHDTVQCRFLWKSVQHWASDSRHAQRSHYGPDLRVRPRYTGHYSVHCTQLHYSGIHCTERHYWGRTDWSILLHLREMLPPNIIEKLSDQPQIWPQILGKVWQVILRGIIFSVKF